MSRHVRLLPILVLPSFLFAATAFAQDRDGDTDFISAIPLTIDLTATAPGPGSPTGSGRPPRVGPNTQVNAVQEQFPNGLLGRSETTIAATDDGQFLVSGFNDAQGFCGAPFGVACTPQTPFNGLSGFSVSTDAGKTWNDGGAPFIENHIFTRGDPWMDRGGFDNSTFYYANLAIRDDNGASLGVSVHRGHFGGGTFAWQDVTTFNTSNPNDFYDKEALAAAKDGSGAAYVTVTNFIGLCGQPAFGFGQIEVWRTHDAGATWQGPAVASPDATFITDPNNPACGATGVLQQSSVPAVGPSGEAYVVWSFGPTFTNTTSTNAEIRFARSLDGGVTFAAPVTVAAINSFRQDSPVGYNRDRMNDHPRIAVATTGPDKGRIYVAFYSAVAPVTAGAITPCPAPNLGSQCRAQRLTSSQVFVTHSDDRGTTWSTPVPVAPAPPATGIKRWWPVVTVEPGGVVDVVYYQSDETPTASNPVCNISVGGGLRRRGTANSLVDTFWARSIDGGATFDAPIQVTTATSNWCTAVSNIRPNFGDYIGSAFGGNRALPVWADGRNGVPDVFFSQALGAGKSK
jgi:hypothetical protein